MSEHGKSGGAKNPPEVDTLMKNGLISPEVKKAIARIMMEPVTQGRAVSPEEFAGSLQDEINERKALAKGKKIQQKPIADHVALGEALSRNVEERSDEWARHLKGPPSKDLIHAVHTLADGQTVNGKTLSEQDVQGLLTDLKKAEDYRAKYIFPEKDTQTPKAREAHEQVYFNTVWPSEWKADATLAQAIKQGVDADIDAHLVPSPQAHAKTLAATDSLTRKNGARKTGPG